MLRKTYDIHGILTVESEVGLPELAKFQTNDTIVKPSIRVSLGKTKGKPKQLHSILNSGTEQIYYNEGLGPIGFSVNIEVGDTIDVVAAKILQWSPHVLYTNVVEPILRWTFVKMNYTLVHAACLSFGNIAYLITAKTDTGKTTTILRILNRQRRASDTAAFISDDLTILSPDGHVLSYPKPLTISSHTLKAVNSDAMALHKRLALIIQSRIHSRGGRRFALLLARTKLPVATINTLIQMLIPPPKFHVEQLVPIAKFAKDAKLAGMIVIERGENGVHTLGHDEAVDVLQKNSADAFGFPPYPEIEGFLSHVNGEDLQVVERQMVSDALADCPTTVISRNDHEWWKYIPSFVDEEIAVHFDQRIRSASPLGVGT